MALRVYRKGAPTRPREEYRGEGTWRCVYTGGGHQLLALIARACCGSGVSVLICCKKNKGRKLEGRVSGGECIPEGSTSCLGKDTRGEGQWR